MTGSWFLTESSEENVSQLSLCQFHLILKRTPPPFSSGWVVCMQNIKKENSHDPVAVNSSCQENVITLQLNEGWDWE